MYTGVGCRDCRASGVGIAPAVVALAVKELPAVQNWLNGHSDLYTTTLQVIPEYGKAAAAGDVCAYIVLRAWSGEQTFCRYAIDHCHSYYLGTSIGQAGPCGAADSTTKSAAAQAFRAVDAQRPDMLAAAQDLVAGVTPAQPNLTLPGTTSAPGVPSPGLSIGTAATLGIAALVGLVLVTRSKGR